MTDTRPSTGTGPDPARALTFPEGFVFGAATSAFQIEGAARDGGRGESIWDRFCERPGAIADRSNGLEACDHYARWADDIELMRSLHLDAYRFSIAWPRVVPNGVGPTNHAGLDFYERLVDRLLAVGITPLPTLYHWDLPQALEDAGGWTVRSTAEAFAEYAAVVVERLGDRVPTWMTLNEPFVSAGLGHVTGDHAPGHRSQRKGLAAAHHLMLGHALAVERIRDLAPASEVGIVLNFTPAEPASDDPAAVRRCEAVDDWENRWYIEPLAGRGYPQRTVATFEWDMSEVRDGDMERIAAPIDVLGINYYTRQFIGPDPTPVPPRGPVTALGWEIHPASFGALLRRLHDDHDFPTYLITENGAAMPDTARIDGRIDDRDRIAYLRDHLAEVHAALSDGMPIAGYCTWSLLDNFEWAHGYVPRFGLVEVDYATQERIPKASARWYSDVARTHTVP